MTQGMRQEIQLYCAVVTLMAGVVLLFFGFFTAPEGEIHNSVLVAFGEICSFVGAIFGIDYHYKKVVGKVNEKDD